MKKALFLIHTEFVLLVSYLYYKIFLEIKGIEPIFIVMSSNPNRFKNINFDVLPGMCYKIPNDLNETIFIPDRTFETLMDIDNVVEVVFQNPAQFITQIFINKYISKNTDCRLVMISDSAGTDFYFRFNELVIMYLKLFYRVVINRIPLISKKIYTEQGMSPHIDAILAHRNIGVKEFININELFFSLPDQVQVLDKLFNSDIDCFMHSEMIIFTQPLEMLSNVATSTKKSYRQMLEKLCEYAQNSKITTIIKVHPSESFKQYASLNNEYVNVSQESNLPAELIMNVIEHKIIVSFFSSVSLFDKNLRNKHFWLYKMIDYPLNDTYIADYIVIPDDFEQFEMQVESILSCKC